jgi:hypothetical protein
MRLGNPFKKPQPGNGNNQAPPPGNGNNQPPQQQPPAGAANGAQQPTLPQAPSNGASVGLMKTGEDDKLELVNYSPEQLIQRVEANVSRIEFGWSWNIKWMENYSEVWSFAGPVILLLGTIGEVFLVLWLRQTNQDVLAGLSIIAVALVMEGTFLTVSFKSATMRNRAERRPNGATPLDKKKARKQMYFWFALAAGVCATQIIFIKAQTRADGLGEIGVWIFAICRSVFTLVADGYTAFAHEEKPTTAERALEEQQARAKAVSEQLEQAQRDIEIFNRGILAVREATNEAKIKDIKQRANLQIEEELAQASVDAVRVQQEQAKMMVTLSTNIMRALFDPTIKDNEREKLLGIMQGMAAAQQSMPQLAAAKTKVIEED